MATTTSAHLILRNARMELPGEVPDEFWAMVDRYRGELVNQALAVLGNLEDAEDVVQETLCEAFRQPERLTGARSLGAWLRAVNRANALNRAQERRRAGARAQRRQREAPPRFATTGGFSMLELRESVAQAIEGLPDELREAVVLRYWEGRSYAEIAERLGIPQGTVWKRLSEAAERMYGTLQPHLKGPGSGRPEETKP